MKTSHAFSEAASASSAVGGGSGVFLPGTSSDEEEDDDELMAVAGGAGPGPIDEEARLLFEPFCGEGPLSCTWRNQGDLSGYRCIGLDHDRKKVWPRWDIKRREERAPLMGRPPCDGMRRLRLGGKCDCGNLDDRRHGRLHEDEV